MEFSCLLGASSWALALPERGWGGVELDTLEADCGLNNLRSKVIVFSLT